MNAPALPREVLREADARSKLAGSNRLEILLFSLGTGEVFGINVFKVREITEALPITPVPNLPAHVEGVVSLRGNVIPVIALSRWFGREPGRCQTMMVTEVSCHTQAFLVEQVDRIVRVDWERVRAVDQSLASAHSLVHAYTELPDGKLVSVLDVEQILADVFSEEPLPEMPAAAGLDAQIVFADDSQVARRQIAQVLDRIGVRHHQATNGVEAWNLLQSLAAAAQADGVPLREKIDLVLTDAEMPEMDGYVLTQHIKADPRFAGIPVVMHSSLSSEANRAMGRHVGVDAYVPKFAPLMLADTLRPLLDAGARRP